ncbi:MAG TPA: hypothetical protein VGO34_15640 [Alphaproteobacteria bacterium]|jgi:predicted small lipoprotein YifL
MTVCHTAASKNPVNNGFRPFSSILLAAALASALAGCGFSTPLTPSSKAPDAGTPDQAQAPQFTDIPIPAGARMDLDRSLVLGPRDSWTGRLVFTSSAAPNDMFEFYARELPRFNWTGITAVRAGTSVLSYSRDERIATVQISRTTLGGSEVLLTISPRSSGATSGVTSSGGFNLPAVSAPPVSRQPLR